VFETNIVVPHNQIPHISLTNPSFLRSRRHSRRHDENARILATRKTSPLLFFFFLFSNVFVSQKKERCEMKLFFSEE